MLPDLQRQEGTTDTDLDDHIQRITRSIIFNRAETLKRLLLYLHEHRKEDINEYAIAVEALRRRPDFDPKFDAAVRVQISRLRKKLKEYYEYVPEEPRRVDIPMGTHDLVWSDTTPLVQLTWLQKGLAFWKNSRLTVTSSACIVLILISGFLLWKDARLRAETERKPSPLWHAFLGDKVPVHIILPTPAFFSFSNSPSLRLRATNVNNYDSIPQSNWFRQVSANLGQPRLESTYTVSTDTLAAIQLSRYFDSTGVGQRVNFNVSSDFSQDSLEHGNVIALGSYGTLEQFRDYLSPLTFHLVSDERWIDNTEPASGEMPRYPVKVEGPTHIEEPALIAVLPGKVPGLKIMILQGRHTSGLVDMLTGVVGSKRMEQMYREHRSPEYFEAVVYVVSDGTHILDSRPVALHAFVRK